MKKQAITPLIKAEYIVSIVKSVNKSLEYALDIVVWYSMTDKEDELIREQIKNIWSNKSLIHLIYTNLIYFNTLKT